ncbi:MAG: hypothetical protein ACTSSA_05140, partial [Candidatus Freyarchaeota archaeon]
EAEREAEAREETPPRESQEEQTDRPDWYDEELEALCEGIEFDDDVVEDSEGERREDANEAEREDWYDEELEALCEGIEMEDDASDGLVDRGEERAYEWLEPPDPEEIWEETELEKPVGKNEWLEPPDPEEIWEETELEKPVGKNEWLEPPDPEEMEGEEWDEGSEPPNPEETEESERVGPLCEGGVEGVGGAERVGEGEGASKLRRWDRVGGEGLAVSPERGFTHSREWGRRETPGGGWAEYYAEAASVRDEGTGATAERAYVFARGETVEGDRVTGVGRADGAEFPAWVEGDEGWFEEIYVRAERSSVVENWETRIPNHQEHQVADPPERRG